MHYFFVLLCMALVTTGYIEAMEPVVTYFGTSVCNETIVLGSRTFSATIDFSVEPNLLPVISNFSCNFRAITDPLSLIAFTFLSSATSVHGIKNYGCTTKISIISNELNIEKCNFFPKTELSSYEFVDIQYEIQRIKPGNQDSGSFRMLLFTYSYHNRIGRCRENETLCFGSRRCVYGPLQCSSQYDYCDNDMRNCPHKFSRSRSASFSGVYVFLSCLLFLLGVTIYMCFCRGVHLFECICHCCSATETAAAATRIQRIRQNEQEDGQTGNDEGGDVVNSDIYDISDNESEINDSADDSVIDVAFGLPPSYSYIERNFAGDDVSENSGNVYSGSKHECKGSSKGCAELPPSYSTVLGHEEEYNVH